MASRSLPASVPSSLPTDKRRAGDGGHVRFSTHRGHRAGKEITANAYFDAASPATLYGRRASTSGGLTLGYYGGNVGLSSGLLAQIANGTLSLAPSVTNYIVAQKSDGAVSVASTTTNWNDTANYWRLYSVVCGASTITSYTDSRLLGAMTSHAAPSAPVTKTGNFTLCANENEVICNGSASITVTLPAASALVCRRIRIKTVAAFTVVSASSNVVPLAGGSAGTSILSATAGKFAEMVSDGTNWIVMAGN